MATNLKTDARLWRLAADLGLRHSGDPIEVVLRFCRKRVLEFLREHPRSTLTELLELAAVKLDAIFVEVHTDEQLAQVRKTYCAKGELAFADLENQLSPDVYAITFGLQRPEPGERKFVAVIDCRGAKRHRSYFSKWHELAHLLTLTPQMRLRFCRTHVLPENKDPEESLMDIIAGEFAFFPEIVSEYAIGQLSFAQVERLRVRLAPESSQQAALIGLANAWPKPCLQLRAEVGLKKGERRQESFGFASPVPVLRAVKSKSNELARSAGLVIPQNMRVPSKSVIASVFSGVSEHGVADENLDWWESSGKALQARGVRVEARRAGNGLDVLISLP